MLPYCVEHGVGVIPWSPLARGRLTRDWEETTRRSETDRFGSMLYGQAEEADRRTVEAVATVATERGVPRAQVALAWVMQQPAVTAPIVGVTKQSHLDDAVAAVELQLTDDELRSLEEHYVPRRPEGF
jgi:aryl-alcohol dehydrogenase-like predicted oxidoreductase